MARVQHDFGYRLRLEHPDRAELRLLRVGRAVIFDPDGPPELDDIVVLTGSGEDRTRALRAALGAGRRHTVVAPPGLWSELSAAGAGDGGAGEWSGDGLHLRSMAYDPPAEARPSLLGAPAALARGPRTLVRSLVPRPPPREAAVWEVGFADGTRLVHLDLALHAGTDEAWVHRAVAAFGGPEWLLIGCPYGEGDALLRWLPRFCDEAKPTRVLLTDLVNTARRERGLPTELITPLRDRLLAAGLQTHVFATQASFRFE